LTEHFAPIAKALEENEETILAELMANEGKPADLGGYYLTDKAKTDAVMRASATMLRILG
jgi:isocitrate dehydrogenase